MKFLFSPENKSWYIVNLGKKYVYVSAGEKLRTTFSATPNHLYPWFPDSQEKACQFDPLFPSVRILDLE